MSYKPVVITHGGAGGPREHDPVCELAAKRGGRVLEERGPLEAVIQATEILEDDARLNAGTCFWPARAPTSSPGPWASKSTIP